MADCKLLEPCLEELAQKYPRTKFLRMISTECIPNYPDRNLPTVLLYKDTKCMQSLVGLGPYGGRKLTTARESLLPTILLDQAVLLQSADWLE